MHETDPSNYKTMWDRYKTRFGREGEDICEESVRFGNFESNDEGLLRYDTQNLRFLSGLNEPADFMSPKSGCERESYPANFWSGPRLVHAL